MAEKEQVLIEVQFDASAVKNAQTILQQNLAQLRDNKKELAAMEAELKKGNDLTAAGAQRYAELKAKIEENNRAVKSSTAIIQASTAAQKGENDSLDAQRQYLNTLQKAFAGLTAEQKEMMGGQEALENAIKAVSDKLKEQEHAIGDDRRNVGNYTESIEKAFGKMAEAGELMSPAINLLKGMGGEGAKAATVLESLSGMMQFASKASQTLSAAQQAQKAATQGATIAQNGLNAAMNANPIGLIITGITTLLPLIQNIASAFGSAEEQTKAFNDELERQNQIIEQAQKDANFEAKVAGIMGASAMEQLKIQRDAAIKARDMADDEVNRLLDIKKNGSRKERKAAEEALQEAYDQQKKANERVNALNEQMTLQGLTDLKKEEDDKAAIRKNAADKRKADQDAERAAQAKADRDFGIAEMEGRLMLLKMQEQAVLDEEANLMAQSAELLASLDESEEEEDIPTPDEMCRDMFGLDEEGVQYFKSLLDQGVEFSKAKTEAIANQTVRMTKSFSSSFSALGGSFNSMAEMLGEFSAESEDAANAQKAFTLMSILLNQASSIANGALAISEGIASAASLPFPANIPAIISIVAEIGGLMAGVGTSIVQAKNVFSSASDAGKFASGGIVGGTSYSGDRLTAHVNSREMILPVDAQKNLFDALSTSDGANRTLGIDYGLMAEAVAAMPAPVMDYTEFKSFEQEVSTYSEIASI